MAGGIGHFVAPGFFVKIVPPTLPFRMEAVYITGFFELMGALFLLWRKTRRAAGLGLFFLTLAVTPANFYMWRNAHLFPDIPESLLVFRLILQALLLMMIWWATQPTSRRAVDRRIS